MAKKSQDQIVFQWVRTHNLKNIDITIPKNEIITITWVSGSGKSSLAFDTIYKEWQFRYIESLSSYLRQFFNLGSRPEIDYSEWLSPAIAIEQNKRVWNSRSTVWTLTEIDDYLRLMFAKLWDLYCYSCGTKIKTQTTDQIVQDIKEKSLWQKIYILQELHQYQTKADFMKFVRKNKNRVESGEWFIRYLIQLSNNNSQSTNKKGWKLKTENWEISNDIVEYFYLEEPNIPEDSYPIKLYWIFDRVTIEESKIQRLREDIIKILSKVDKFGVYFVDEVDWKLKFNITWYTDKNFCANCNITYPEFTTQHFSPNRPEWACEMCHWLWETLQVDFDKIIDPFSNYKQAILPWRDSTMWQAVLDKIADKYSMDKNLSWKDQPDWFKDVVLRWDWELLRIWLWAGKFMSIYYKWVEDILTQQYHKWVLTVDFQAMLNLVACPTCWGSKLRKESLNVFIDVIEKIKKTAWKSKSKKDNENIDEVWHQRFNIFDLQRKSITELIGFLENFHNHSDKATQLLDKILTPLLDRSKTIDKLWLGYINTIRQIDTLSGWEIQRLRLAKQLWNKLTWIIYVLDEPTIWLDQAEIEKVIDSIKTLKDMWNTIIVVEHNDEFIKNSDWVVEIWPWAWDFGGNVVFNWPYDQFLNCGSLTAQYVTWKKKIKIDFEHKPSNKHLQIKKASKHNLKGIDVKLQLWSFTIITWWSWAWKTTLMYHTLFRFLEEKQKFVQGFIRLQMLKKWMTWSEIIAAPVMKPEEYEHYENLALQEFYKDLGVESIQWHENIKNVIYVDQTSIGKTPRSCPATFVGVFDDIRTIFAWVEESKMLTFGAWHFSFNSSKWACPECDWYGYKHIELQFLPDTYVPCELCRGKRYKPEILWIKWRWKSISEVLDMYVKDAAEFFSDMSFIKEQLDLMVEIWLWYLKMWQPAHTLSWWESQRIKLVKHLLKTYKWHTIYFLDEPTVWLHPSDIERLLKVLKRFLDKGDTILMIEHDRSLLKYADNVIRLDNWNITK